MNIHEREPVDRDLLDEQEADAETTEAHERRIVRCRSCREQIVFLPTSTGKSMPIDAHSVRPTDTEYVHGRHESHFATCANAAKHRRPR